jgi:hypothetical protein
MSSPQRKRSIAAAAIFLLAMAGAALGEQPNNNQQSQSSPPQGADFPTPEQKEHIAYLLAFIESQPAGFVFNNSGIVARPPNHKPYNPDGSRNQNFRVAPDPNQAQASAVTNHEKRRASAMEELIKIGRPAVPQTVTAIVNEGNQYRFIYAFILGEIKDPRAVPALIKYMNDGKMKLDCAASYRKFGDEEMAKLMEDEGQAMIADATGALESITGQDYGPDIDKWRAWWEANKAKYGTPLPLVIETADPPPGSKSYAPPSQDP